MINENVEIVSTIIKKLDQYGSHINAIKASINKFNEISVALTINDININMDKIIRVLVVPCPYLTASNFLV